MDALIQTIIATLLLAAQTTAARPAPPPDAYSGSLSRYDAGVMDRQIEWHLANKVVDGFAPYGEPYAGYIAVVNCRNVGRAGWMTLTVEGEVRSPVRVYVTDCASPGSAAARWMEREQIAAEIDHAAWVRLGIVDGRGAWAEIVLDARD